MQAPSEDELVEQAQSGNMNAFSELVLRHQKFVYNLALRGLGDANEAEDLAQEAFIRAWRALPRFRRQAKFRTWLYRIVVNLCYNRLPQLRQELAAVQADEDDDGQLDAWPQASADSNDPLGQVEAGERRNFLHHQMALLPDSQRMLLLLRYQDDFSYEEIAQVMEMPLGTVKTGLFRAKGALRQALGAYEEITP